MNADALEAHLRANPEDMAGWSAYADFLTDQGDPRGEFMRVQLALEDPALSRRDRDRFQNAEAEILDRNRDLWLGPTLASVAKIPGARWESFHAMVTFRRGWPDCIRELDVRDELPENFLTELAGEPLLRWVTHLHVMDAYSERSERDLGDLDTAYFTPNLRTLEIGEGETNTHMRAVGLPQLVRACPLLEKLIVCAHGRYTDTLFETSMPSLRELGVHCNREYPCEVLARNASLTNLRTLRFRPHVPEYDDEPYLTAASLQVMADSQFLRSLTTLAFFMCNGGDNLAVILADSDMLYRLEMLDLSHGRMTDAGLQILTRALKEAPNRMRSLILNDNALTPAGIEGAKKTGLPLTAVDQHARDSDQYLWNGDIE